MAPKKSKRSASEDSTSDSGPDDVSLPFLFYLAETLFNMLI